jgi:hypothetical protein
MQGLGQFDFRFVEAQDSMGVVCRWSGRQVDVPQSVVGVAGSSDCKLLACSACLQTADPFFQNGLASHIAQLSSGDERRTLEIFEDAGFSGGKGQILAEEVANLVGLDNCVVREAHMGALVCQLQIGEDGFVLGFKTVGRGTGVGFCHH